MADEANGSALEKTLRALLLVNLEPLKQKQQIAILDQAGFGRTEIAEVVGSTPNAVGVRLAEIKKDKRKNQKK